MKNVWVPGERLGEVPFRGEYEEYENLLGGRWAEDEGALKNDTFVYFVLADEDHDIQLVFSKGTLWRLSVQHSLVLDGVQLFGRTPDELAEALGAGAEAYQEPWVDEELWMVGHERFGLLAFYYEAPYDSADSISLSLGKQGG